LAISAAAPPVAASSVPGPLTAALNFVRDDSAVLERVARLTASASMAIGAVCGRRPTIESVTFRDGGRS